MNNRELADTFTLIANLLEIKGEVVYVTLAYRKAAESLLSLGGDVNQYWKEEKLREIPGIGKSIAEKIDELLRTGTLEFLDKLEKEVPAGLADHCGDLELVIHFLRIRGIRNLVFGTVDVIRVGEIEDGKLVPFFRHLTTAIGIGSFDMRLKRIRVAQGGGARERSVKPGPIERDPASILKAAYTGQPCIARFYQVDQRGERQGLNAILQKQTGAGGGG